MQDPSKSLPAHSKAEYDAYVSGKHRKDSLLMFNRLLTTCFDSCIEKFHGKLLTTDEKACISHCTERQMKTTQRVGFRYSEMNFIKTNMPKL